MRSPVVSVLPVRKQASKEISINSALPARTLWKHGTPRCSEASVQIIEFGIENRGDKLFHVYENTHAFYLRQYTPCAHMCTSLEFRYNPNMATLVIRPKDAARTRERILAAARKEFARVGFARTTVRAVAASADVSPNLITRYFGGKEGLFVAATEVHLELEPLFDGPRESLGRRMAESIVTRWTSIVGEDPLLVLLRAAGEHSEAAETLSKFLDEESIEPLRRQLLRYGIDEHEATDRARAVDVFILGISSRLRVLRDDLGDPGALKQWIAANIQRIVDAP
ncbi:TetR/AcrR family transcriptional regulator [Burkholderia stagnalis]